MFMDGLLVATGFFGALTVLWLVRRAVAYFEAGPKVSVCFGAAVDEALPAPSARRDREVLLLGDVDPALAGPLAEAQARTVALDVLLSPDADPAPFERLNVQARSASKAPPAGLLAIVDDRVVIVAAADGQAVVATGHADWSRRAGSSSRPTTPSASPPPNPPRRPCRLPCWRLLRSRRSSSRPSPRRLRSRTTRPSRTPAEAGAGSSAELSGAVRSPAAGHVPRR